MKTEPVTKPVRIELVKAAMEGPEDVADCVRRIRNAWEEESKRKEAELTKEAHEAYVVAMGRKEAPNTARRRISDEILWEWAKYYEIETIYT